MYRVLERTVPGDPTPRPGTRAVHGRSRTGDPGDSGCRRRRSGRLRARRPTRAVAAAGSSGSRTSVPGPNRRWPPGSRRPSSLASGRPSFPKNKTEIPVQTGRENGGQRNRSAGVDFGVTADGGRENGTRANDSSLNDDGPMRRIIDRPSTTS